MGGGHSNQTKEESSEAVEINIHPDPDEGVHEEGAHEEIPHEEVPHEEGASEEIKRRKGSFGKKPFFRTSTSTLLQRGISEDDAKGHEHLCSPEREAKWREIFDRLDKNNDGVLCCDEWKYFCSILLHEDKGLFKNKVIGLPFFFYIASIFFLSFDQRDT